MKFFIDESNITRSHKADDILFLTAAAAVTENIDAFNEVKMIMKKYGYGNVEIKGSDIMTRENTELREEFVKYIVPKLSGCWVIFDWYVEKSLDITFEWLFLIRDYVDDNFFVTNRHIMVSDISRYGTKIIHKILEKNGNNSNYISKLKQIVCLNNYDYNEFPKSSQKCFDYAIKYVNNNDWIQNIDSNDYKVLDILAQIIFTGTHDSECILLIDEISDPRFHKFTNLCNRMVKSNTITELTIKMKDSTKNIGIQVADLIVGIIRKTVYLLITEWYSLLGDQKKIYIPHEEHKFGNHLLLILKSLSNSKKWDIRLKLNLRQRAFIELLSQTQDISDIFHEKFLHNLDNKENAIVLEDFKDVSRRLFFLNKL